MLCALEIKKPGNSLAVQGLGLSAFTAVASFESLVRELRSRKPAVPNLFGTRDWFRERQFFHGPERGGMVSG